MSDELEILWERPEACLALVGDVVVSLALTSVHSEWLADIEAAMRAQAERRGCAVPMLAVYRLDPRYPLRVGFDANLDDLRRTLDNMRSDISVCGVALEFEGFLATVMRAAMAMVGAFARDRPVITVHDGVVPAIQWLGRQGCAATTAELLAAVRGLKHHLGCDR